MRRLTLLAVLWTVGTSPAAVAGAPVAVDVGAGRDRDSDGVPDDVDGCRDAAGIEPHGCPDADGDGRPDPADLCRDVMETRNGYRDADGCPDELPADLARFTGTIRGVEFERDRDVLRRSSRRVLDRAVTVLQTFATVAIEISGHTDSTGSASYNRELSRKRAEAVKRYLVDHGVAAARLETRGAGPDEPICGNICRADTKMRRIEFAILAPEPPFGLASVDTDGDGVHDAQDLCPHDGEPRNGYHGEDGCPDVVPAELARFTGVIKGVKFMLAKDVLRATSFPVLDRAVRVLRKFHTVRLEIRGHTDSGSSHAWNLDLTRRRAEAVKRYLVDRGIEAARLETRGAGSDESRCLGNTCPPRPRLGPRIEFALLVR